MLEGRDGNSSRMSLKRASRSVAVWRKSSSDIFATTGFGGASRS